jgi:hypothetical protein
MLQRMVQILQLLLQDITQRIVINQKRENRLFQNILKICSPKQRQRTRHRLKQQQHVACGRDTAIHCLGKSRAASPFQMAVVRTSLSLYLYRNTSTTTTTTTTAAAVAATTTTTTATSKFCCRVACYFQWPSRSEL